MKKIWVLILLVSLGLNLGLGVRLLRNPGPSKPFYEGMPRGKASGSTWAQSRGDTATGRQMVGRRLERLERLAKHLNLTAEQKNFFAITRAEVGDRMMARRSKMQKARTDLFDLVTQESTSEETLRRSFRVLAAQQGEMDSVITEVLLRELEILDADQRILYLEMLPMNHRNHQDMRRRGRGCKVPE